VARIAVLVLVGLVGAGMALEVSDAAATKPRRCVLPRGRTVVSTSLIRAVVVNNDNTELLNLYACAYTRNKVWRLAKISTSSDAPPTLRLRRHNGTWVAIEASFASQYQSYGFTKIADAASGRGFSIYSYSGYSNAVPPPRPPDTPPITLSAYFLTSGGRVVAAFTDYADQAETQATQVRIVAFSSRGVKRQLDAAAPSSLSPGSLRLSGNTASWTHDGQVRTAQL
jgi:hypothetical protein